MAAQRVNGPRLTGSVTKPTWRDGLDPRRVGWIRPLVIFVPISTALYFSRASATWQFVTACLAILPLAGLMGEATERLAERLGPGVGGLLNATFGNAAELIIALFALFRGLDEMVKASITGSIIGNLLLVLGASILAGGIKYPTQRFNKTAAGVGGTLMVLAAIGMLVPALFHGLVDLSKSGVKNLEHKLSVSVCLVLLATYALNLVFSLVTHKYLYNPKGEDCDLEEETGGVSWGVRRASAVLAGATVLVAFMSEVLVSAVHEAGLAMGLSEIFMGVIVVAIIGNAAEHSTAILMARKNQMDLAVGIALGSALQIALFVAPVLVFASYLRQRPMDLRFSTLEVVAVILSVMIARMVAEDGESNWLEGAMLLMIYAILGLAFFFLPAASHAL
ncbi:MAG: Ca(2+)/H(+) antiporter [Planctomycetota bacterium]|nr:Ca(2+)/H(+) antiporter [Planctomycetota bacterium]